MYKTSEQDTEDQKSRRESAAAAAKDMLFTLITRAGKGKDEVIQVLGREIGTALVALLKQPVSELFRDQKIQITIELTPKTKKDLASAKAARARARRSSSSEK